MRKKIIYEPTLSDSALLMVDVLGKAFVGSFFLHPYYHTYCKHTKRQSFKNALTRLENRGLVLGERRNGKAIYFLSDEGKKLTANLKLKLKMANPQRWDGKWRILIFSVFFIIYSILYDR